MARTITILLNITILNQPLTTATPTQLLHLQLMLDLIDLQRVHRAGIPKQVLIGLPVILQQRHLKDRIQHVKPLRLPVIILHLFLAHHHPSAGAFGQAVGLVDFHLLVVDLGALFGLVVYYVADHLGC